MSMPPPPPPGDRPPLGPNQPYGTPPPGYSPYGQSYVPPAQPGTSGMAIAGFVLSLIALVPCFWFIIQLPGVLGLVFSLLGLKATRAGARKGRGLAVAGLVISVLALLITVAMTIFVYTSDSCVHDGANISCNFD